MVFTCLSYYNILTVINQLWKCRRHSLKNAPTWRNTSNTESILIRPMQAYPNSGIWEIFASGIPNPRNFCLKNP